MAAGNGCSASLTRAGAESVIASPFLDEVNASKEPCGRWLGGDGLLAGSGRALLEHGRRRPARAEGDASPARSLAPVGVRPDLGASEDRPQHGLHLERGKARPQAPPPSPAERDPCVRARRLVEEALG